MTTFNDKYVDAQNFSQNASTLLLERGEVELFLDSLNYHVTANHPGETFKGLCPVCRTSVCTIGLHGARHKIWWKCSSHRCPSNDQSFKTPKNLLSLVKYLVGGQGVAFERISAYLGYEGRSFNITNGKFDDPPAAYVFVVDDQTLCSCLREDGINAVVYDGKPRREPFIFCVIMQESTRVAREFADATNLVKVCRPADFVRDPIAEARFMIDSTLPFPDDEF